MGIGRREFLKLFGASVTTLAVDPSNAIAVFGNQYVNRKLGIAFRKPDGWQFADMQEMGDIKAGQILDLDDPERARQIDNIIDLPILTISKDGLSADSNTFTPGVTIHVEQLQPDGPEKKLCPVDILAIDSDFCQTFLKEFTVTSPFKPMRVSACDAGKFTASFIFEHENIEPIPVQMQTLAIEQEQTLYTFRMYDAPHVGGKMVFDYTSFIDSIKIV